MKIELREIPIREIVEGYKDSAENGVVAYGGKLDVRPPYQREFIYKDAQRNAVIETVLNGFPLNVMYWAKNGEDKYEVLDGQQRTISVCQYVMGDFSMSIDGNICYFHTLTEDIKEKILNYKLMVYVCEGSDKEKLNWFKTINIAGEKLTNQELRNAVYTGPWLADAKRYFSKLGCTAYKIASKYLSGSCDRQEYLETAIEWIANRDGLKDVSEYMAIHQFDINANEIWLYFKTVVDWVQITFPNTRKEMKGLPWGIFYNKYNANTYDSNSLESEIKRLMMDDDVTNKKGVYEYLLDGNEKHLNIRAFTPQMKREAYERQNGICPMCQAEGRDKIHYELEEMQADHINPWSKGGKTSGDNCQLLCPEHNRLKSDI